MSLPSAETQAKVASDAATSFVDSYYDVLNNCRKGQLAHFYTSISSKLVAAGVKPDISINGLVLSSVDELDTLLDKQGSPVVYEVQAFDAHPVSPNYVIGAPDTTLSDKGDRVMVSVQVSGTVRYGKGEDAELKAFNDAFVLVPHWEAQGRNPPRGLKRWLVASQNYRVL